jgi:hypothetical protein
MAKVIKELALKYAWKALFLGEHGPANPCTILVLMMLAEHMKPDGSRCWPSQTYLAQRTRLGERTVRYHVALAVAAGWLSVTPKERVKGRSWFVNEYTPLIPEIAKKTVWKKPGIKVPAYLRQANGSDDHQAPHAGSSDVDEAASPAGSSTPPENAPITRHVVHDHPAPAASITRHQPPTNSESRHLSVNPTDTGLPKHGFTGGVVGDVKKPSKLEPKSDAEKRKQIVKARSAYPAEVLSDETVSRMTWLPVDDIRRLQ